MFRMFCAAIFLGFSFQSMAIGEVELRRFPSVCSGAFLPTAEMVDFFEQSIASMAIEKGAQGKGVSSLFAVNYLRRKITELAPGATYGNPINKHIVRQLCLFDRWFREEGMGKDPMVELYSNNKELYKHLEKLSGRLLKDSRVIYSELLAERKKLEKQNQKLKNLRSRVDAAEKAGRRKVKDLL